MKEIQVTDWIEILYSGKQGQQELFKTQEELGRGAEEHYPPFECSNCRGIWDRGPRYHGTSKTGTYIPWHYLSKDFPRIGCTIEDCPNCHPREDYRYRETV